MILPWLTSLVLDLRNAVMFCCGREEEDEDPMAQGTGRLKQTKRSTEEKLYQTKARAVSLTGGAVSRGSRRHRQRPQSPQTAGAYGCDGGGSIDRDSPSNGSRSRNSTSNGCVPDMGIKSIAMDNSYLVQTVEIKKRPGQTLGFYIREGDGIDRQDGVFISRIQMGTVAESNGLLHIGDEILTVNKVEVGHMSLDDVVILMSIPKKLILKIRTKKSCNKKNASCPSLAITEQEEQPPVVVLKKGRSSSATALEETEKCPDIFEPFSSGAYTTDYLGQKRTSRFDRSTSQYASIFISPHRAEAKLLNEDGDSEHSSEGSLPRSVDSGGKSHYVGHRGYMSDGAYEAAGSYFSPALSPSQYGSATDRDYLKYMYSDGGGMPRKLNPKSPSKAIPIGAQQPNLTVRSNMTFEAVERVAQSESYSGGQPLQDYISHRGYDQAKKFQGGFREMLHSKAKYGRLPRSRSPECYNSDSEVIYAPPSTRSQVDSRGFSSDYETYAGGMSDDDPIYSIPQLPSSSSTELEELLRKFNTLSHELQQEQCKLQRQLSTRERTGVQTPKIAVPKVPTSDSDDYSYVCTPRQPPVPQGPKTISPTLARKAASTQTPAHTKLVRKHSADALHQYRTYQSEAETTETSHAHDQRLMPGYHPVSRGGIPASLSTSSAVESRAKTIDRDGKTISRPSSRFKDLQLVKKPLQIAYSEFEFYRADMRRRIELSRTSGLNGILGIHVLSGQGLKSSKMSLRDLYCVVSVDSMNKARTMIRTGAVNFDWDEAFDIELEDAKDVSFLIYNWDPNYKHRLCFHGTVMLPSYITGSGKKSVALKMEPKGLLYVTFLYRDPAVCFQRLTSPRKNGVFGIDLETVIKREIALRNVPILIQKCVDEIERRGLEVVGIHRLCGSARRKAQLREAFEMNVMAVSLSPENVSDVHVITGVMKDYLRELPEPLFTNALYQMLLDALSVRLPSDPDGSAKLMLSILECLPKANQETMAAVLNHLKKVASKSEKNKMALESLANCFGPVLLCPSPASSAETLDFKKHIEVLRYLLDIWPENYEMVKLENGADNQTPTPEEPKAESKPQSEKSGPA
ncbi:rho GTPase-activating protein syd-1-like [Mizuhopecten yessoensis]|nr:rho GTPase-activating protein syd-1-like [Mizuhopecten yessoensis]